MGAPKGGATLYITIAINSVVVLLMGLLIWSASSKYNRKVEESKALSADEKAVAEKRQFRGAITTAGLTRAATRKVMPKTMRSLTTSFRTVSKTKNKFKFLSSGDIRPKSSNL